MDTQPPTTELADELAQLVHELRQSLSAARLIADGGDPTHGLSAAAVALLAQSIDEGVEVARALAGLARRLDILRGVETSRR